MPYSQKYWQSLNLVVWPQTTHIGRFKLIGDMVRYRHTYMHMLEMSVGFNLAVERHTDKPPNFRLYGVLWLFGTRDQNHRSWVSVQQV